MRRQHSAAAAIFAALSAAMTWPLAPNLARAVSDPGDPFINIWILDWDWWATLHQPLALFHANAFHPARYSLAFSENLYGVALLLFPLRAFGVSAIAAYNIAMLAGFAFSGFAAYLLGRRLTGSFVAGIAAGVFYAFVPFRFVHIAHVQHVWGGWLPLLLVTLLDYADAPTRKRTVLFAAVFVMNGLTNIHYLLFGALASAITAVLLIPRSAWRELLMATGVALLVLAPFLYPYYAASKLYGMERTWEEAAHFSATAADWLPGARDPERRLYPGALAYVFAVAALLFARREKAKLSLALLWLSLGFLGSLGMHFELHRFLFGAVPGFKAIRVPARWAVIAYIGLAILIALATHAIARRNRWLAWLVPIAFTATLWVAPIRWYMADPVMPEVHRWLATRSDVRAILELPIDGVGTEYDAMLHATAHHKPMVNGISGFAPPQRLELARLSHETPISDAFYDAIRAAGVDTLIIRGDFLGGGEQTMNEWLMRAVDRGQLTFVAAFDSHIRGDRVYRLGDGHRQAPVGAPCRSTIGALDGPTAGFTFEKGGIFS
ncbi:MAG TPA: hypothetical protein VJZ00_02225, partial [Thermoanaerobaculia bacterium]|nr:hypothetical protein [Thermoanaerobaculia bacterium]